MGLDSQELPPSSSESSPGQKAIICGSGEMADRVREHDWAYTSIGPIDSWSSELVALVNLTLSSPTPARLLWTAEFILIYNDAYRELAGPRHPSALGRPAKEVWPEAWHIVGSRIQDVFSTGTTGYYEKSPVPITKNGSVLDSYLTYSYCPVYENG